MASATFTPDTSTNMPNPERGIHLRSGFEGVSNPSGFAADAATVFNGQTLSGLVVPPARLMHTYETLTNSGDISGTALTNLGTALGSARTQGIKIIPRFRYGSAGAVEPSLSQVQRHTQQLAPVLATNRDVLFGVEMGFIGPWGEWADSTTGLDSMANKTAIKDAVVAMVPPEIPVICTQTYPMQEVWFSSSPAFSDATAFNGSDRSRMGSHSDSIFTSNGDSFRYVPLGSNIVGYVTTKSRFDERRYVMAQCVYSPYGGETVFKNDGKDRTAGSGSTIPVVDGGASPSGDPGGILVEGPTYCFSYLNRGFTLSYWAAWNAEGATINTVYRQLGYRFQFDSLTHSDSVARGGVLLVKVQMHNVGWSRIFSQRRLMARLVNGGNVITGYSSMQLRQLPQQATASSTVIVPVTIPGGAATGSYALSLEMPDVNASISTRREYKIRPANTNSGGQTWDDTNGRFATGTTVTVT